jgi:ABC-type transport system involved in multi-copper enzyme maturation permease subunit
MSGDQHDAPWTTLTRHFFHAFFRLSFLDDAGEESFTRAVIGVLAGILALGLLLARVYLGKYVRLTNQPTPDLYRWMLPADQLLMICLPMLTIAFVMGLVVHALFPDEIDFRILMALPLSRQRIFSAKVAALLLFVAIFIVTANVSIGLPFALVSTGRWADHSLGVRALAQITAGMFASVFAAASIIALQGLIVVLMPRTWLRTVSVVTQTALICGLVLSLPIVGRIPTFSAPLHAESRWLSVAPPVWFLGVEQWLLGSHDPSVARHSISAALGTLSVVLCVGGCYLTLYRRFDRVVLGEARGRPPLAWNIHLSWPMRRHPAQDAIQAFMSATLRRSSLHQLALFAACAAGVALAVNSLVGSVGLPDRWLVQAALWTPLALMVAATLGLRAALLLPTNLRAAWIFRLTDDAASRPHQLNAVRQTLLERGVIVPVALAFPVQAAVLGWRSALACLPVIVLLGWIFVEITVSHWRRLPFTCTILFGKRPAAFTLLIAFVGLYVFGFVGMGLQQLARSRPMPWLIVIAILLLISTSLRRYRLQTWGHFPFEFEDHLPNSLETLGL